MSPRPEPPSFDGPSPRSRWTVPCLVPAGTRRRLEPFSVGTSTTAPSSASGIVSGTSTSRLSPTRLNTGESRHARDHVQVARLGAAQTGLALAGQPDPAALADPGRDVGPHPPDRALGTGALAGRARVVDHRAGAMAVGAGLRHREDALALSLDAAALADRADARRGAGLGARAVAGRTRLRRRHRQRHLGAVDRLLEGQRDLGLEVTPARRSLSRAAADPAA